MADYYPTYLNLAGKKCVIIGGGTIAQGKIAGFRDAGATITLISPDATPGILKAANDGYIQWFERKYEPGDLKGAFIAVVDAAGSFAHLIGFTDGVGYFVEFSSSFVEAEFNH